ncbi:hypothetical protein [Paraburkholderia youngii]|uniref:hypothetical protein n=1 Tax=Paraburkholderia youngii TaxID=2782701 RepID=UPI003D244EC0
MIIFGSFVQESIYQHQLLLQHGLAALDAYKALLQASVVDNLGDLLTKSVSGQMAPVSARTFGLGAWVFCVVAPAAAILVTLRRVVRFAMAPPRAARAA